MKRLFVAFLLILGFQSAWAQQDPQFSLYMFNKQVLNPGYIGSVGMTELTFAGRSQWVGIEGHPNTGTFSFNTPVPILFGALGAHLIYDVIGPFTSTGLRGTYAFRLPIGQKGVALNLGISPGIYSRVLDATNFRPQQSAQLDPVLRDIVGQRIGATHFDLGFGAYLYKAPQSDRENGPKYYAGFAIDHLLEPSLEKFSPGYGKDTATFSIARTFGVMGGYRFDFKSSPISFVPSVYFKLAGSQMQLDVNANFHIRPMVFGISYRGLSNVDAIAGILGFHATQRLFVAYSYDYTLSSLGNVTSGSHEIVVSYTIPKVTRFRPPVLDVKSKPDLR